MPGPGGISRNPLVATLLDGSDRVRHDAGATPAAAFGSRPPPAYVRRDLTRHVTNCGNTGAEYGN
jgi:hypothetical protein